VLLSGAPDHRSSPGIPSIYHYILKRRGCKRSRAGNLHIQLKLPTVPVDDPFEMGQGGTILLLWSCRGSGGVRPIIGAPHFCLLVGAFDGRIWGFGPCASKHRHHCNPGVCIAVTCRFGLTGCFQGKARLGCRSRGPFLRAKPRGRERRRRN